MHGVYNVKMVLFFLGNNFDSYGFIPTKCLNECVVKVKFLC